MLRLLTFFVFVSAVFAAAPAVWYNGPDKPFVRVSSTINIAKADKTGYYFATQMYFENKNICYMGFQPRSDSVNQHLTFSGFGEGYTSDSAQCSTGADGGSGVSCSLLYPWKQGQNYTIDMQLIKTAEDGSNTWRGTVIDPLAKTVTKIAHYTTPKSFGLLTGSQAVAFNEFYPYNTDHKKPSDRSCIGKTSYVQFNPVYYDEDGNSFEAAISSFYQGEQDDQCALAHNAPNALITKLNATAARLENGIFS